MARTERTLLERRSLVLGLSLPIMVGWAILIACGFESGSAIVFPCWALAVGIYMLDVRLKLRLLYEGMLGTVAYFVLHDIPANLDLHVLSPSTKLQFYVLLLLTGALAALPFGRRGPAVAGISGSLLGGLWVLYSAQMRGWQFQPAYMFRAHLFPALVFITLGGLVCERLLRSRRGEAGARGAHPGLWGFILGAAFTLLTWQW